MDSEGFTEAFDIVDSKYENDLTELSVPRERTHVGTQRPLRRGVRRFGHPPLIVPVRPYQRVVKNRAERRATS